MSVRFARAVATLALCVPTTALAEDFPEESSPAARPTPPPPEPEREPAPTKGAADAPVDSGEPRPAPDDRVSFVARPGVTFYSLRSGPDSEPQRICIAPCRAQFSSISVPRLALGFEGDEPIPVEERLLLRPGAVVEGEYRSRESSRNTGLLILGIGAPASLAAIATGVGLAGDSGTETLGVATAAGGGVGLATSLILGLVLSLASDEAHVALRPE